MHAIRYAPAGLNHVLATGPLAVVTAMETATIHPVKSLAHRVEGRNAADLYPVYLDSQGGGVAPSAASPARVLQLACSPMESQVMALHWHSAPQRTTASPLPSSARERALTSGCMLRSILPMRDIYLPPTMVTMTMPSADSRPKTRKTQASTCRSEATKRRVPNCSWRYSCLAE